MVKGRETVMREERYYVALDRYDKNIVVHALNDLRTKQIQEKRPTDPVDELIGRVARTPSGRAKCVCKKYHEER